MFFQIIILIVAEKLKSWEAFPRATCICPGSCFCYSTSLPIHSILDSIQNITAPSHISSTSNTVFPSFSFNLYIRGLPFFTRPRWNPFIGCTRKGNLLRLSRTFVQDTNIIIFTKHHRLLRYYRWMPILSCLVLSISRAEHDWIAYALVIFMTISIFPYFLP